MDVRRLGLLRELADRGTVTAVAQALHLTPSAVSQQLKALEREAGVALTERSGAGSPSPRRAGFWPRRRRIWRSRSSRPSRSGRTSSSSPAAR